MNFIYSLKEGIVFLHIEGDLIGENNEKELAKSADDYISEGYLSLAVDISQVRYINSSGISVLITLLTKFRNKGGEVILIKPSEHVQKLLIISKLNGIFTIVNSEMEAIGQFLKA